MTTYEKLRKQVPYEVNAIATELSQKLTCPTTKDVESLTKMWEIVLLKKFRLKLSQELQEAWLQENIV